MDQRFIDADTKNFSLIFFAFVVGIVVGVISSIFRLSLAYIEMLRDSLYTGEGHLGLSNWILPFLFAVGGIGIALLLVKRFAPEASGSGVHEIEGALDEIRPLRWKRVLPVKFFASLFSLGSGLLLGREGPTVQIGANIGKMIKDLFRRPDNKTNPLVSAGAAAGLASAFNAPLSGIIFVIEEMQEHFRWSFFSVAAIMVASGTADFVVRVLVDADPVIKMMVFPDPALSAIWLFIILGALFGFVGQIFNQLLIVSLDYFASLSQKKTVLSLITAGLLISVIGILNPAMLGGGYTAIRQVLDLSHTQQFLIGLFLIRLFLTLFSYGLGVPGGIFAPLLALGVIFGTLYGNIMQPYFPALIPYPGVFAVAGMAGIFASTVRAPLTGLVLAIEMTSNFELILPLIITSVTASLVTAQLGNRPVYTILLERTMSIKKSAQGR